MAEQLDAHNVPGPNTEVHPHSANEPPRPRVDVESIFPEQYGAPTLEEEGLRLMTKAQAPECNDLELTEIAPDISELSLYADPEPIHWGQLELDPQCEWHWMESAVGDNSRYFSCERGACGGHDTNLDLRPRGSRRQESGQNGHEGESKAVLKDATSD